MVKKGVCRTRLIIFTLFILYVKREVLEVSEKLCSNLFDP